MEIVNIPIDSLKEYENNPRINDNAVEPVARSIESFGFKVPIVVDSNNVIIAGHTRLKAARFLGMDEVPCIIADDLTDDQVKAFRLADNKVAEIAEWDIELLMEELDSLEMDMGDFGFIDIGTVDIIETSEPQPEQENQSLVERFTVPPFSVLDTRQGYWQDRKRGWKECGISSKEGRSTELICNHKIDHDRYGKNSFEYMAPDTSEFDPVLCEVSYKWFCPEGGSIIDPFAGGSVRGIVASKMGFEYTGIDLRQEQVDANYSNAKQVCESVPTWICDDSRNLADHTEKASFDMVFSCPPYADLEVYSDDPRDLSRMEYQDFLKAYRDIIKASCEALKDDRFAVFVVGEVRGDDGAYRDFVGDTKRAFVDAGLSYYNEMVLVNVAGTAALRAARQMNASRKVAKTHQNVLVFYKGDMRNIKETFGPIDEEVAS